MGTAVMTARRWIAILLALTLAVLVGIGLWKTSGGTRPAFEAMVHEPEGVMGTSCRLVVVVNRGDEARAEQAVAAARSELSRIEALMSSWIERSEVSQLNAAPVNQRVPLSPDTMDVLRAAQRAQVDTRGSFDVTCRPIIELWREAGESGRVPDDDAIAAARAASQWPHFERNDDAALRTVATAKIDLGGIAKGYAIDRAIEAMRACDVAGGMVDVGGDIRCFGRPADSEEWRAQIRDPAGNGVVGEFRLGERAVCTSGDYARFVEIAGRRYSHIIDPRTGRPAEVSSVTVVAPDALTADIWATALAVDGADGLARLPTGVDAFIIYGSPESPLRAGTAAFRPFLP